MRSRRAWVWLLALPLVAAALFVILGRVGVFRLKQEVGDGLVVAAQGDQWAGQSFLSHYPGLDEIAVRLADPALPNPGTAVLHLRENSPGARDILTLQRSLEEARDGDWLRFGFAPIDDSAARTYFFFLEFMGEAPLQLAANSGNMYPEGESTSDPAGDLVFQAGYHGAVAPTLLVFLRRVSANKPGPLGWPWFYVALLLAYLAALVGASYRVIPQLLRPSPGAPERPDLPRGPGGDAEAP